MDVKECDPSPSCVAFMSNWVKMLRSSCSDSREACFLGCVGRKVCTDYHTGPKTVPTFSKTFLFSRYFWRRQHHHSPSAWLSPADDPQSTLSEWTPLQKVFVLQQSRGFIPSLWRPNEALCCLIPRAARKNPSKEGLAVFHQRFDDQAFASTCRGWGFLLEPAQGNRWWQQTNSQQVQMKRRELK